MESHHTTSLASVRNDLKMKHFEVRVDVGLLGIWILSVSNRNVSTLCLMTCGE